MKSIKIAKHYNNNKHKRSLLQSDYSILGNYDWIGNIKHWFSIHLTLCTDYYIHSINRQTDDKGNKTKIGNCSHFAVENYREKRETFLKTWWTSSFEIFTCKPFCWS